MSFEISQRLQQSDRSAGLDQKDDQEIISKTQDNKQNLIFIFF